MATVKSSVLGVVVTASCRVLCVTHSEACYCTVLCTKDRLPAARKVIMLQARNRQEEGGRRSNDIVVGSTPCKTGMGLFCMVIDFLARPQIL